MSSKVFRIAALPNGTFFEWTRENRACPHGEWEMPLTVRTVRDDLPGGSEPVEQIMGWNYDPQTFEGLWDDRYLGPGVARATLRAFETFVKRASKVRIEFEQETFEGIITKFVPKYKRADYIGYSFTVSPHKRPTVDNGPAVARAKLPNPSEGVDQVRARTDELVATQAAVGGTVGTARSTVLHPPFQLETSLMDEVADGISVMIGEIDAAKQQLEELLETPQAGLRVVARFQACAAAALQVVTRFRDTRSDTALAYEHAIGVLEFDSWTRFQARTARITHRQADDWARETSRRAKPATVKVYRPYKGESVYTISQKFYGTPHEWRRILDVNHITSPEFAGTERLLIPEI